MGNGLYDAARAAFLGAQISWSADTIKAALVSGYTASLASDQFLADVTGTGGGTIAATTVPLTGKTTVAGVANAGNITWPAVAAGPACAAFVIFKDTGTPSTSPLIAYFDTASGLPVTPAGVDITVQWDAGANHIFKL